MRTVTARQKLGRELIRLRPRPNVDFHALYILMHSGNFVSTSNFRAQFLRSRSLSEKSAR